MALFPVNQNVQWFTPTPTEIDSLKDNGIESGNGKVWFTATSGEFQHRSDTIDVANGGYIKLVKADDMAYKPKVATITFDTNVNDAPIHGEVYGIYLNQRGYNAIGERHYMELGAEVRFGSKFRLSDTSNDETVINTTTLLMQALAKAFERNLGKKDSELYTVTSNETSVIITEKEPAWILGLMAQDRMILDKSDFHLSNITVNSLKRDDWATVTISESTTNIPNSKVIADMEWFYLGEHGDQQRLAYYPYANAATIRGAIYNIDANSTDGYDLITIHHSYVGNGTFVQKSEKDIMIAVPKNKGEDVAKKFAAQLGNGFTKIGFTTT